MASAEQERARQADQLYEQYGKPLEAEHWGEFIAITTAGRTVIGPTLREVTERAEAELGLGVFVFKIGPRAVGKIR
jgi:hypothetical protein